MGLILRKILICLAVILFTAEANSQTLPDTIHVSGEFYDETPTDSLGIRVLDSRIAQAAIDERRASFWYRLIPDITLSAGFGIQGLAFVDPSSFDQFVLPRDTYRLTLTLSLTDVLNFDRHSTAQIRREELEMHRDIQVGRIEARKALARAAENQLNTDLIALTEQDALINELLEYAELLFSQGDIRFDEVVNVRLRQLQIRSSINRLLNKQSSRKALGAADSILTD